MSLPTGNTSRKNAKGDKREREREINSLKINNFLAPLHTSQSLRPKYDDSLHWSTSSPWTVSPHTHRFRHFAFCLSLVSASRVFRLLWIRYTQSKTHTHELTEYINCVSLLWITHYRAVGGVIRIIWSSRERVLALSTIPCAQIKKRAYHNEKEEEEDWMERAPCMIFFGRGYDIDNSNGNRQRI